MSREGPLLRVDPAAALALATQLSQQLAWLIASGELRAGDQLPPVRELASDLDINLHTVRAAYRELEADGLITTRQGRRATVAAYDRTKVAARAPNLPSFTVGVIIPAFAEFYAPMLDGIEAASAEHQALTFICNARDSPDSALTYLDRLVARRVDGIIVAFPGLAADSVLAPPGSRPFLVFIDDPVATGPSVQFDLEGSTHQATSHMIEHGHSRIAYLTPPIAAPNVVPKHTGYQRALHRAGLAADSALVTQVPDFTVEAGYQGTIRLFELPDPPTAIVAANDTLALGAMHAIASLGLHIPDDVALVGNDNIGMAAVMRPALTTVALPAGEAGIRAATMLQQLIAGRSPEQSRLTLRTHLVVRETCGCPTNSTPRP